MRRYGNVVFAVFVESSARSDIGTSHFVSSGVAVSGSELVARQNATQAYQSDLLRLASRETEHRILQLSRKPRSERGRPLRRVNSSAAAARTAACACFIIFEEACAVCFFRRLSALRHEHNPRAPSGRIRRRLNHLSTKSRQTAACKTDGQGGCGIECSRSRAVSLPTVCIVDFAACAMETNHNLREWRRCIGCKCLGRQGRILSSCQRVFICRWNKQQLSR